MVKGILCPFTQREINISLFLQYFLASCCVRDHLNPPGTFLAWHLLNVIYTWLHNFACFVYLYLSNWLALNSNSLDHCLAWFAVICPCPGHYGTWTVSLFSVSGWRGCLAIQIIWSCTVLIQFRAPNALNSVHIPACVLWLGLNIKDCLVECHST